MSTTLWIITMAVLLIVVAGLFIFFRRQQRSGDVFASRPAAQNGGPK